MAPASPSVKKNDNAHATIRSNKKFYLWSSCLVFGIVVLVGSCHLLRQHRIEEAKRVAEEKRVAEAKRVAEEKRIAETKSVFIDVHKEIYLKDFLSIELIVNGRTIRVITEKYARIEGYDIINGNYLSFPNKFKDGIRAGNVHVLFVKEPLREGDSVMVRFLLKNEQDTVTNTIEIGKVVTKSHLDEGIIYFLWE